MEARDLYNLLGEYYEKPMFITPGLIALCRSAIRSMSNTTKIKIATIIVGAGVGFEIANQ